MRSLPCTSLRLFVCFLAILLSVLSTTAQNPTSAPQLTDAQAGLLLQKFIAAQANSALPSLTVPESQSLVQYILRKSLQSTALNSSPGVAKARTLLQGFGPSQGTRNNPPGQAPGFPAVGPAAMGPAAMGPAIPAAAALGPKKPGNIRIGVVMPKAQLGQGAQGPSIGEPLRGMISQYLAGPHLEIAPMVALLPQQIDQEAKDKQCDFLVYSSITQKKASGGMGFLKGASNMVPMVGMMGAASAMAGASGTEGSAQAASVTGAVKAKSEVAFEYQLLIPGSPTPVLSNALNAKAKVDGEDVVSPMLEQAATAILAQVTKKK